MLHYLPLKKDFSNFDQVVEWLGDSRLPGEITENAHRDPIRSGRYSYERFVQGVDEELLARGLSTEITPKQRALMDNALQARARVASRAYRGPLPQVRRVRRAHPKGRPRARTAQRNAPSAGVTNAGGARCQSADCTAAVSAVVPAMHRRMRSTAGSGSLVATLRSGPATRT